MKIKKVIIITICVITAVILTVSFVTVGVYSTKKIYISVTAAKDFWTRTEQKLVKIILPAAKVYYNKAAEKNKELIIGDFVYKLEYHHSTDSGIYNTDVYKFCDDQNDEVSFFKNTDDICTLSLHNYIPQETDRIFENTTLFSDEEIKLKIIEMLKDYVDFSQYNHFEFSRHTSENTGEDIIDVKWVEKRGELETSNYTRFRIEGGLLYKISIANTCPEEYAGTFLTDTGRNELIEKAICKYYGISSIDEVGDYSIEAMQLTRYRGKEAIYVHVNARKKLAALYDAIFFYIVNNDS
ncbi:MAG: hypothetical protein IJY39_08430 [Clostridia bacterium]|nr:hypothetical protein [Clostridia bacterium]